MLQCASRTLIMMFPRVVRFAKERGLCDLEQARYSGFSQWHNVTNLSHTFWGAKDKKDILFKVRCQDADLANSAIYDL